MKYQIIKIDWVDSYGHTSRWEATEDFKPDKLICTTVGFLLHENENSISLSASYAPETENTVEQVNGIMTIPKSAIVASTKLTAIQQTY